jgi:hypothetical protein
MERTDWTLMVYRFDKRCKEGEKLRGRYEYCNKTEDEMLAEIKDLRRSLYLDHMFRIDLYETYVTRTNLMSGKEFKERFDTPHYCSPAFESYWSM